MNLAQKKELKAKSLRKGVRQAKMLFWKAEAKVEYWCIRLHRLPLTDKRWKTWHENLRIARLEMEQARAFKDECQTELNEFKHKEKKNESKRANKVVAGRLP
jgi:hypothetical protein